MVKENIGILTGGSVAIMDGANKGACQSGVYSVGVVLDNLSAEQKTNDYLHTLYRWHDRIDTYYDKATGPFTEAFPGGDGTICEVWDKIVNDIIDSYKGKGLEDGKRLKPIVLVGKKVWESQIKKLDEVNKLGYLRCLKKDMIRVIYTQKNS